MSRLSLVEAFAKVQERRHRSRPPDEMGRKYHITIFLTADQIITIEEMIATGFFFTRSEAIRYCLTRFILEPYESLKSEEENTDE